MVQTGIGTTGAQQLYKFTPGEVQYGEVEDILSRRARAEENAKGLIDNSVSAIASAAIPNKIGGGTITIPETAQVVVATGETAVGATGGALVFSIPTLSTDGAKALLIASSIGNNSNNSDSDKNNDISNEKQEKSSTKDKKNNNDSSNVQKTEEETKPYYETKKGKSKAKKYLEKGETLEQHYEKYAIENVEARGINVGRSKEHSNMTIGHWEKAVDIADEASKDPNVKAVYVDEALTNVSFEKFGKESKRPDVTIEYNDGTFKLIEVQSTTDYEPNLRNKLKGLQTKYGKDVVKDYKVEKPKGKK